MKSIQRILKESITTAVVGLSPNPSRDTHRVARYLQNQGYKIIPVNPNATEISGEKAYPDVASIPEKIDIVDIFRRSENVVPIAEEAIKAGAETIWMQLGIINQEAGEMARRHGLNVVMDRCTLREHQALQREGML